MEAERDRKPAVMVDTVAMRAMLEELEALRPMVGELRSAKEHIKRIQDVAKYEADYPRM